MDRISVIGLGRLGLPLAVALASRGFKVVGVDIDRAVIEAVNRRHIPYYEPGVEKSLKDLGPEKLWATSDIHYAVRETEASIIMVNTPSLPDGSYSLSCVFDVCRSIGKSLKGKDDYHLVIISSTVPPSSCKLIQQVLETESGKALGDFGLCYSPEMVALGNVLQGFLEPDFVLIGTEDVQSAYLAEDIYRRLCAEDVFIRHTNFINAELAKVGANCFLVLKITFANQLAELCEGILGADVDEVTSTIALDSRISSGCLRGATAYAGFCYPRDMQALTASAGTTGMMLPLMWNVDKLNQWQVDRLVRLVRKQVADGDVVGVLGLAFKPNTNQTAGSVGIALLERLGISSNVVAYDPLAQVGQSVRTAQICADRADVLVITIPCPEFREVKFHKGQVVIDCWRMLTQIEVEGFGAKYIALGRFIE